MFGASLELGAWCLVLSSRSHPVEDLAEQPAEAARRSAIGLHRLRVLDQADGGRKLRVLESTR